MYNRGETVLSDNLSFIFVAMLLAIMVVVFIGFGGSAVESKIQVDDTIYSYENIFVLESYLNSPTGNGKVISDLVNDWLLTGNKNILISETESIFDKVYGECYVMDYNGQFFIGDSSFTGHKASCIDYPNFENQDIYICIDFSDFDEKLTQGKKDKCF
jgi:hypothetical protein